MVRFQDERLLVYGGTRPWEYLDGTSVRLCMQLHSTLVCVSRTRWGGPGQMACVSGGGATCSQSPFRQVLQVEHALTPKETCGSNRTLGIRESDIYTYCNTKTSYISDFGIQIFSARFCCVLGSSLISSLHCDLNKPKHNYGSLYFLLEEALYKTERRSNPPAQHFYIQGRMLLDY